MFAGHFKIEVVTGGTDFEGGVVLGVSKDYEESDVDKIPSDNDLCIAKCKNKEEMFQLVPKDDLAEVLSRICDDESEHYLLEMDTFPILKDVFWSIGHHYVKVGKLRPNSMLQLLSKICPRQNWVGKVPRLAGRIGKGKRGGH